MLVTGGKSKIVQELQALLPQEEFRDVPHGECDMADLRAVDSASELWTSSNRLVLAHGTLSKENFRLRTSEDLSYAMNVNLFSVLRICEWALGCNPNARIVVMGSESVIKGSYDVAYWMAKAGLHEYVRNRKLWSPSQQLVCVAPSLVNRTGMTSQKTEGEIAQAIKQSPKARGIEPREVAQLIRFLLFSSEGYITNTVIEMNGGKFARRG